MKALNKRMMAISRSLSRSASANLSAAVRPRYVSLKLGARRYSNSGVLKPLAGVPQPSAARLLQQNCIAYL